MHLAQEQGQDNGRRPGLALIWRGHSRQREHSHARLQACQSAGAIRLRTLAIDPNWRIAALLLLLCGLLQLWPAADHWLAWQPQLVADQQWWRLFSAVLVHTNGWHLLLNAAGLLLCLAFRDPREPLWQPWLELLLITLLSSLLLLLWPQVGRWVGLSGPLHGWLLLCLWSGRRQAPLIHLLAAVIVIGKVISEQLWGGNSATASLIEARVLVEGHAAGVVAALLLWPLSERLQRSRH